MSESQTLSLLPGALEKRSRKYFEELRRCKAEFSEEAVHDLRVSIRRLLALAEVLKQADPHPSLKKLRRNLKEQLDYFDDLRDTQVMLVGISENIQNLPGLAALQTHLQKQERRLLKQAAHRVAKLKIPGITHRINKITARLQRPTDEQAFTVTLLGGVDDAYATACQRHGVVRPEQPASIHRVRVAFKKFRYMIEIIHPTLPGYPAELLPRMHDYQTLMGEIQDAEVLLQALREFGEESLAAGSPDAIHRYAEQRLTQAIAAYMENRNEINVFWRETPEEPFPWQEEKP